MLPSLWLTFYMFWVTFEDLYLCLTSSWNSIVIRHGWSGVGKYKLLAALCHFSSCSPFQKSLPTCLEPLPHDTQSRTYWYIQVSISGMIILGMCNPGGVMVLIVSSVHLLMINNARLLDDSVVGPVAIVCGVRSVWNLWLEP